MTRILRDENDHEHYNNAQEMIHGGMDNIRQNLSFNTIALPVFQQVPSKYNILLTEISTLRPYVSLVKLPRCKLSAIGPN